MDFLRRKRSSLRVTMDGRVHMVEVTKNTTCDDVIRQLLQSSGQNCSKAGDFSVYKLSSDKVKLLDNKGRIWGKRRLFWTTSNAEFFIKRKLPEYDEDTIDQTFSNLDDETFCQSPSYLSRFQDLQERIKAKKNTSREMSLTATSNLNNVYSHIQQGLTNKGGLCDKSMDSEDDYCLAEMTETFGQVSSCSDMVRHNSVVEMSSILSDGATCINGTLVFKKALKTKSKQRSGSGIAGPKMILSGGEEPAGQLQDLHLTANRYLLKNEDLTESPPLHSTPMSKRSASRLGRLSVGQFIQPCEKNVILRRFFSNQESTNINKPEKGTRMHGSNSEISTEETATVPVFDTNLVNVAFIEYNSSCDSSVCTSTCALDVSSLDKGFVADDVDEGIVIEQDLAYEYDLNKCPDEDEQLDSFMNTMVCVMDSDDGLSSLGTDVSS